MLSVAVALAACSDRRGSDDEYVARLRKIPARAWLGANKNPLPLASNRFRTASEARAFVDKLFLAGAVEVYVAEPLEEPGRVKEEGGPYADILVIVLPPDFAKRHALFSIARKEALHQGFTTPPDSGQKTLFLWWD